MLERAYRRGGANFDRNFIPNPGSRVTESKLTKLGSASRCGKRVLTGGAVSKIGTGNIWMKEGG